MRFLSKVEEQSTVQKEFLYFLNRIIYKDQQTIHQEMLGFRNKLEKIARYSYDKKSFIYLDIISWVNSKVDGVSLAEVIQKRFKADRKAVFV